MQSDSSSLPILPKNMETQGGSAGPASQLGNVGASFKSPPRVEVPARSEGLVHFSVGLVMVPPRVGMALIIAPCVRGPGHQPGLPCEAPVWGCLTGPPLCFSLGTCWKLTLPKCRKRVGVMSLTA